MASTATAGETPGGGDPSKIFKMIQDLEGQAADLRSGNSSKTEQSLSSVYKTVANDLKKRLFVDSGANAAIPNMQLTPEQYQQLHSISPRLAQEVASAKTVSDLRSIEAPFVRASQLAERSMNRTNGKPFDLGDTILAAGGMLHPAGLGLIGLKHYLSSNTGKSQVGGAMMKNGSSVGEQWGNQCGVSRVARLHRRQDGKRDRRELAVVDHEVENHDDCGDDEKYYHLSSSGLYTMYL